MAKRNPNIDYAAIERNAKQNIAFNQTNARKLLDAVNYLQTVTETVADNIRENIVLHDTEFKLKLDCVQYDDSLRDIVDDIRKISSKVDKIRAKMYFSAI